MSLGPPRSWPPFCMHLGDRIQLTSHVPHRSIPPFCQHPGDKIQLSMGHVQPRSSPIWATVLHAFRGQHPTKPGICPAKLLPVLSHCFLSIQGSRSSRALVLTSHAPHRSGPPFRQHSGDKIQTSLGPDQPQYSPLWVSFASIQGSCPATLLATLLTAQGHHFASIQETRSSRAWDLTSRATHRSRATVLPAFRGRGPADTGP